MAFIDFKKCFSEPKYVIRLSAVIICLCIASYQLSGCVQKIMHPPVNTYYGFNLNKSMHFPCITICRSSPYKTHLFPKFNISNSEPSFTSFWRTFDFNKYTIQEFFDNTTYNLSEFIFLYGFAGIVRHSLNASSFFSLTHGRCFTFTPKKDIYAWSSDVTFMFYLKHTENKRETFKTTTNDIKESPPQGFHVYIHKPSEMFADTLYQDDSFMEYIQVEIGEAVKLNLRPHEFSQVSTKDNQCSNAPNYAKSRCREMCLREKITAELGCQTPWLPNDKLPECNNFDDIKDMLQLYRSVKYENLCNCPRSCNITVHKPYVQNRQDLPKQDVTQLTIYYASNLVTSMNEFIAYDWNIFLADLGGSLGFLLGLSVLGVIGVLENILLLIVKCTSGNKSNNLTDTNSENNLNTYGNIQNEKETNFSEDKSKEAEASQSIKSKTMEFQSDCIFFALQNDYNKQNKY